MIRRVHVSWSSRLLLSTVLVVAFGLGASSVRAATLTVDTTSDIAHTVNDCSTGAGSSCSLRDAINQANTDGAGGTGDTIVFGGGVTGTIALGSPLPAITVDVTINGPTTDAGITISGANTYRVFSITSGAVILNNLTIANGNASGSSTSAWGGGIFDSSSGLLTIAGSTFLGNQASSYGGAIAIDGTGALTVTNSTFSGNGSSSVKGGALYLNTTGAAAAATIVNSTFSGNSASKAGGGAIYNENDTLTVNNSILSGDTDECDGPGGGGGCPTNGTNGNVVGGTAGLLPLGNYGGPTETYLPQPNSPAVCKGVYADAVDAKSNPLTIDQRGFPLVSACVDAGSVQSNYIQVTNNRELTSPVCPNTSKCTLRKAIATANGQGDIDFASSLSPITVTSALNLAVPSSSPPAVLGVNIIGPGAHNLTVNGGSGAFSVFTIGAGFPAVLYGMTVSGGNPAGNGGGISNSGDLTLLSSAVSSNTAGISGGGIDNASGSTALIQDSTISGNTAGTQGGGINSAGTLEMVESTVSDNTANNGNSAADGAGIYTSGKLTVINSTIAANKATGTSTAAPANVGGGIDVASGTAGLANTIVSGNTVGANGINSNIAGTYVGATNAGNVIGGSTDNATSQTSTGAAISLASLDYFPATASLQTQIPLPGGRNGNPAICGGLSSKVPSNITTDERGEPISSNDCPAGSVDAGAAQTNYTMSFTTQPPSSVAVNAGFGSAVTLDESGAKLPSGSVNIPLTLSSGTLYGTATEATSSGVAAYSNLNTDVGNNLTLGANLSLNAGLNTPLSISATSTAFTVTHSLNATVTNLTSNLTSAKVGDPVTFTATISPNASLPAADIVAMTGSLTFSGDNTTITCSSQTFSYDSSTGTATATCITSDLPAGTPTNNPKSYAVTAVYNGDANYAQSRASATSVSMTVSQGTPVTSLTCTANNAACNATEPLGTNVTFTEKVSAPSGGIPPTGTVAFTTNGGKTISGCNSVSLTNGSAQCSTSTLSAQGYTITAAYSGDGNYASAQDTYDLTIGQSNTTLDIASSSTTTTVNQAVTFTATIKPSSLNPPPTGTVSFVDTSNNGASVCPPATVDSTTQQASCSTQGLSLGTHNIEAQYNGDSNYSKATSSTVTQTVNQGASSTSVSSSTNPSVVNAPVTFAANVTVPSGPTGPTGTVTFYDGTTAISTCSNVNLTVISGNNSGTATCDDTTSLTNVGQHTIKATYSNDTNFADSSDTLTQNVQTTATTTTIAASPTSGSLNQPVTYTVNVEAAGSVALTGDLSLYDNGVLVTSCGTNGVYSFSSNTTLTTESVSCTENGMNAGTHTIRAEYTNDLSNGNSTGSTTVQVAPASSTISVTSSAKTIYVNNPKGYNDSVTFTATMAVNPAPTNQSVAFKGDVSFTENGLPIGGCTAVPLTNSEAQCTTDQLPAGADTILAVYNNDPNYTGSTGSLSQVVMDYSLAISSTPPVLLTQGYSTTSDLFTPQTISVVPLSIQGFSTASGSPLNLSCSVSTVFSPDSSPITPLCTPTSGTLSVNGTGAQGAKSIKVDGCAATDSTGNCTQDASAGVYTVTETGEDPTTGLMHTASFQATVNAASAPLTLVSGATTGNSGNLTFMVPGRTTSMPNGVTISSFKCESVAGPNLNGSVTPASLGISCSFNPSSVTNSTANMQAMQVAVTVNTDGTPTTTSALSQHTDIYLSGLLGGLPLIGLVGLIRKRKSLRSVFFRTIAIVAICFAAFQVMGCGGSFMTQSTNTGGGTTPPGVYKVLVVGHGSDNQTYEAVLQLNVKL